MNKILSLIFIGLIFLVANGNASQSEKKTKPAEAGFKLVKIPNNSIYEKLGLKEGDILTKINGQRVDSPKRAAKILDTLQNADHIDLDVIRAHKPLTFHYAIKENLPK